VAKHFRHTPIEDLRPALDLAEEIPIVQCDARRRAPAGRPDDADAFLHSLAMTSSNA